MPISSTSPLARNFALSNHRAKVQTSLSKITNQLSTGRVDDTAKHLRGNLGPLSALERRSNALKQFQFNSAEASSFGTAVAVSLDEINGRLQTLATNSISVGGTATVAELDRVGDTARASLDDLVANYRRSHVGRALFSGASNSPALDASGREIIEDFHASYPNISSVDELASAAADYFSEDGPFISQFYRGGGDQGSRYYIAEGAAAEFSLTAASEPLRDALRSTVLAALVGDSDINLSPSQRQELNTRVAVALTTSAGSITDAAAINGIELQRIEAASVRVGAEINSLDTLRQKMVGSDPFVNAAALEETSVRLEMIYSVTARLSQLSLSRFL